MQERKKVCFNRVSNEEALQRRWSSSSSSLWLELCLEMMKWFDFNHKENTHKFTKKIVYICLLDRSIDYVAPTEGSRPPPCDIMIWTHGKGPTCVNISLMREFCVERKQKNHGNRIAEAICVWTTPMLASVSPLICLIRACWLVCTYVW